ncbi:MAG: hypothetical protein FWF87_04320 [Synergistaceae bacterium]|nr:hypothetical protein [Synergistaceae bacterium]
MKSRFFIVVSLTILVITMFCSAGSADLLSALPKMAEGEANSYLRYCARFTDARKLIEDLYPAKLFEALEPLSSSFGLESLVKMNRVVNALSKSYIREFALLIVMDYENTIRDGGVIMSVPDSVEALNDVATSRDLTFYNLVLMIGGRQLLEAIKATADSFEDYKFECDNDGVFFYRDNYVCIEGDVIIAFETKETTLSVANAVKAGVETRVTDLESPNLFSMQISRKITKTPEDIKTEIGVSYENSTWKIKTKSNLFRLMSRINILESDVIEKAQNVINTIPMVGRGEPFFSTGGNTFINGADSIEERLMYMGDMTLTLNWATLLQMAHQYGISKQDIGNLFAGSAAMIFGLDSKFFGLTLPLSGYIAFTGKNDAASKIIGAISKSIVETGGMSESKIDGWDSVYSVAIDSLLPNALIAQRGETLLVGVMNPEDLTVKLDIKDMGLRDEKIISWLGLNFERIWASARNAYPPLSVLLLSGAFGDISSSEKEAVQFVQHLLKTDFPIKALNIWASSLEEVDINITMNPSSKGDFWKVLFMWLGKVM